MRHNRRAGRRNEGRRWNRALQCHGFERFAAATGLVTVLLANGCASLEASRRSPGAIANGAFSPTRSPAAQYGPDPTRSCPTGGALPILAADLDEVARGRGKPAPQADGRLCAAAETFLGWDLAELPDESVVSFVSWYFGLPAPVPRVIITTIETEEMKDIAGRLVDTVSTFARTAAQPRFGLATSRVRKKASKVVLLMQDASVDLDPLPRRLALNSQATLSGRLLGALDNPKILISDPPGRLETPSVPPGKAFRVDVRCGDRPGRMQVEIRGEEKGAESILASFPVGCGTDLPSSAAVRPPDQGPVQVARHEQKLLELINAERVAAGLAALAWDDAVAGVARAVSESRREEVRGGTAPPLDLVERLKRVDVISPLVLQNPARARSAEEAHARFSASPAHRSNFMSAEATHAGVGIAVASEPGGRSSEFVTELFVRELPPVDTEALRGKLRAAITQKRADARAPPIAKDATLEDVAQKYAQELAAARGTLAKAAGDQIVAPLHKSFRTVNLLSGAKGEPLEFAEEPGVVGNGKLLGIGVAQGAHPVLGKNSVYVVVIIGTRR